MSSSAGLMRVVAAVLVACLVATLPRPTGALTVDMPWREATGDAVKFDAFPGDAAFFSWTGAHSLW